MAYEVIKQIGARQYRYRVQSERDANTGKSRNRWTYIGRVGHDDDTVQRRPERPNARRRLLAAAESIFDAGDAASITVDAIASAAGVAHGTFYRYFRDRADLLQALALHLKEARRMGDERQLDDDASSRDAARAGVRRWVTERLTFARDHRSAMRGWFDLIASDAKLSAFREERREMILARLRTHIEALRAKGFIHVADPAATAAGIAALIDGVLRASVIERDQLDDAGIAATADIAERALFARL
jgi:AcrR family transcriptional regulator